MKAAIHTITEGMMAQIQGMIEQAEESSNRRVIKCCRNSWLTDNLYWTGPSISGYWPEIATFPNTAAALLFLEKNRELLEKEGVDFYEIEIVYDPRT